MVEIESELRPMSNDNYALIGAVIGGSVAYLIPLYFGEIWLGLTLLLLISFVYLGSLIRFTSRRINSKTSRRVITGFAALLIIIHAFGLAYDYSRKDYQKNTLLEIRKTIDTGVSKVDVQADLIYILGQYQKNNRDSIVETARDLIPEKLGENGVYIADHDLNIKDPEKDDNTNFFYETDEEEDTLTVVVVSDVSIGKDPEFDNYDGQAGRFEMVFTLSKEGVDYEVRN